MFVPSIWQPPTNSRRAGPIAVLLSKARVRVPVTFVSTFAICEHCSIEIEFLVGVRIRWCRRSRETFRRGDTVKALLLILMLALAGVAWARSHRYIHFGALSDRDVLVACQEGTHPTVTVFDTQVNIGCTARPATVYASEGIKDSPLTPQWNQ